MSFFYSTSISVGLILGLCSGALYLVGHTYYYASKLRRCSRQSDSGTGQANPPCPCDGASEPPHTPSAKSALQGGRMRGPGARGLRCALCGALVCRACSRVVRPSARIRLCGACFQHRELTCPSSEWFYRELRTKFHEVTPSPSSSSDSSLDVNLEVREFIERLTENLVSGSVDDVTVEPLSTHPQYETLCSQYHTRIQDTLSRLSQSLQLAITDFPANKITSGESPSELHVQLKRQIVELRHEAMQLPLLEMDMNSNDEEDEIAVTSAALDFSRRTYEDLLATAIINKVVENSQCVLMEEHLKTPTNHTHVEGENCSQTCGAHDGTGTFISCFQIGIDDYETDPEEKEKQIDMETVTITETRRRLSEDEDSYLGSPENTSPDEEPEMTVRRTETTRRTDTQRKTRTKRRVPGRSGISSDMQRFLEGLKYSHRVPFPELGADIVEGSVQESLLEETARTTLYLVNSDSHHSSLSSASWEENWLFQRRRLRLAPARPQQNKKMEESRVPMLVPNPRAEDSHVRAKIGDMDADQLSSDLSDYESYMSREDGSSGPEDSLDSTRLHGEYALGKLLGESAPEDLIEATNEEVGATLILGPQNNGAESEFDQQEGEYLEDFASIGQRSLSSLQEASRSSLINEATKILETTSGGTSLDTQQEQHETLHENIEQRAEQVMMQYQGESELMRTQVLRSEEEIQIDSLEDDPSTRPPRPGTIAEREHLKWQHATPMLNNPYSEENITRRLGRRQHSILDTEPSSQALRGNKSTAHADITPQQPLKINCSAPIVDVKQYGRDYYINEIKSAKKMENNPEEVIESPQDDVNTVTDSETIQNEPMLIEEPVLSAAPSLTSLVSEDHADSAVGSATSAISFDEEEEVKMPCVRELAKQFAPPLQQQRKGGRGQKMKPPSAYNNDDKSIVIVELNSDPKPPAPAPVHSLTARNLSKEFRAGLRGESAQRPVENGVKDTKGAPRPAERHRANLEFWRSLDPPTPTPAPRNLKKK